jgi:hypothetical protein
MMKLICLLLCLFCLGDATWAQTSTPVINSSTDSARIVEAACGECKFGMKGKGCNLAVRIDGKAYFVDGTKIDEHGDAHADDGFCNKIRKARVSGTIVNDRFVATGFKLLPEEKVKP